MWTKISSSVEWHSVCQMSRINSPGWVRLQVTSQRGQERLPGIGCIQMILGDQIEIWGRILTFSLKHSFHNLPQTFI